MRATRALWSAYLACHLRGQAQVPFAPLPTIARAQTRRVRQAVGHAYRTVPYYRETMDRLGLRPQDFARPADLARLPLVERHQVQHDPEYFVSKARPLTAYLKLRSGGSSGAPLTVFHDAGAIFQNAAHGERERRLITARIGKAWGYRETVIASPLSSAQEVQAFCRDRSLFPRRVRIERQYLSLLDPPAENVRRLNEFKPDLIQSYGSYLDVLFPYLHAARQHCHLPRVVTYSSDGLSESVRHLITETFGIEVFATYQAIEAFKIGFECERHRGLHLNVDLYPVRIIDAEGRPRNPGESGDVVMANLVNRATVLLNYRLGDVARLLPDPCPCGRTLPLLSLLEGRTDDWVRLPSGRQVHPQAVRTIFTQEEEIWQYQVTQEGPTRFHVAVVAADSCERQGARQRLAARFARTFGADVSVVVDFVETIDRTAGGKVRPVRARLGGSP